MPSLRSTVFIAFLATAIVAANAAPNPTPVTASAVVSSSTVPEPSFTSELERTDGKGYYPAGKSYEDPMMDEAGPNGDGSQPGSEGKPKGSFMSMSLGAQIGIIVAVVVVALTMFGGAVAYYIRRRKTWEKEMIRRSTILQQKSTGNTPPSTSSGSHEMKNGAIVTTDLETGKQTVRMPNSAANLPPQTPTWKRWMVKDV